MMTCNVQYLCPNVKCRQLAVYSLGTVYAKYICKESVLCVRCADSVRRVVCVQCLHNEQILFDQFEMSIVCSNCAVFGVYRCPLDH